MTQNQIAYLNYAENHRHNKEDERISTDKNKIAMEDIQMRERSSKRALGGQLGAAAIKGVSQIGSSVIKQIKLF